MTDPVQGDAPSARFDASALAVSEDASTEIEIYNPRDNSGTGIFVTVLSRDSDRAKTIQRGQFNRRFRNLGRGRGATLTAEEAESEAMEITVGVTKAWRGMLWAGKDLACTPDNVRMVYTASPIIREQVEAASNDRTLFTTLS